MAKLDISQRAPQRILEGKANEAFAVYTTAAELCTAAWKAAGRPREGMYFDATTEAYAAYMNALDDKQEAYQAWQRAASAHGKSLMPQSTMQET